MFLTATEVTPYSSYLISRYSYTSTVRKQIHQNKSVPGSFTGTAHRKSSSASGWQILARQMTSTDEPRNYDTYLKYKSSSGMGTGGWSSYYVKYFQ